MMFSMPNSAIISLIFNDIVFEKSPFALKVKGDINLRKKKYLYTAIISEIICSEKRKIHQI